MQDRLIVMSTTLQEPQLRWLEERFPQFRFRSYARKQLPPKEELAACEVLFNYGGSNQIQYLENCRYIHTMSAGIDGYLEAIEQKFGPGFPFTNGAGVYNVTLGEHSVALLLACLRGLVKSAQVMPSGRWATDEIRVLGQIHGSTIAILGTGDIGNHAARALKAFGPARLLGYKLNPCPVFAPYDEILTGPEGLRSALERADYVLVCLPGSPYTKGLIGREQFQQLRPGAGLVNIGRGSIVDTQAMTEALASGRLAFAAMDVTDPEPLPADHPLWRMENVLITPHYAGLYASLQRHAEWFAENLQAFLDGKPLPGAVNAAWRY